MSDSDRVVTVEVGGDPLGTWKGVSAAAFGVAVAVLCYKCGVSVFHSILVFFPVLRMVKAICNNHSEKFFAGLFALAFLPVVTGSEKAIKNALYTAINSDKFPIQGYAVLSGIILTVLFLIIMGLSSLISKALPKFKFPKNIYKIVLIIIFSLGWFMSVCGLYCVMNYSAKHFIQLPGILNLLLAVLLLAAALSVLYKMFRKVENAVEEEVKVMKLPASGSNAIPASGECSESDIGRLAERPTTRLADVAGMEEVKKQIRLRLIEPVKHRTLAAKYGLKAGGGVLLYGPPGTGKTFIARAVAGELNLPFYMITSADVFGKYVGESEKNIRELFNNARKNPLSVVFIDELEVLFGKRTENIHETTQKVISVILQELDGVSQNKNPMLLLGATNTPWKVDEAFLRPGRFDILAFVDLPDLEARKHILKSAFKEGNLPMEAGLIDYIAENSKRFSGADLNGVVVKMRQNAFERKASSYSLDMAYEILLETTPTSTGELLRQIKQWEKERKA